MKTRKFISIIWGYSPHMYAFAPEENYHLHALKVAKDLGFKTYAIVKDGKRNMENDPNFDKDITAIDYGNAFLFFWRVLSFSFQGSLFYVNSYEWQSFVVPFLARRTVFMAHTEPKRKTVRKQRIQNFVYGFFQAIRLNNNEEKEFLLKQGISSKKLFVVPLVVSQDTFKIIGAEGERKDLAYFGNVTKKKNLITILKAFEIVKDTRPEIKMHIIGNIWDKDTENIIEAFPFKNGIVLHGFLPNDKLVPLLNQMLIYLNSSTDEGQCVAVYDAALSGCTLCLPNIMSFEGVFKDKALFHDVFDYQKLAKNISFYLDNKETAELYNKLCIEMIRKEYSTETVEKKLSELFSSI